VVINAAFIVRIVRRSKKISQCRRWFCKQLFDPEVNDLDLQTSHIPFVLLYIKTPKPAVMTFGNAFISLRGFV